jgi:hypothetical protein
MIVSPYTIGVMARVEDDQPSSPMGDTAVAQNWCCGGAGFCHTSFHVAASKADTMPLMPSVKSLPRWNSGVAFGPAP